MTTLKTILVPHDFSSSAQAALEHGRALAAAFDASLHVLHVVTEPLNKAWAGYTPGGAFIETVEHLRGDAQRRLEELLSQDDVTSEHVIVATAWGDPTEEILKYARSHHVGLVVCGTHGRRGWNRVEMGSVAEHVVRLAPCPVLTVHSGGTTAAA